MNDDMTVLRETFEAEAPSPAARSQARAALLARANRGGVAMAASPAAADVRVAPATKAGQRWWSSWAWRSGIATVAAAAVVGGFVVVGGVGSGSDRGPDIAAGAPARIEAIELAANFAAAQPFTPPRPDQWIYTDVKFARPGQIALTKGQKTDEVSQSWTRADGRQNAHRDNGQLVVTDDNSTSGFPPRDYATLATMPTDPAELLTWLKDRHSTDFEYNDETAFSAISSILGNNLLPSAVTASLLRALALIPGVDQSPEPVDIDGRPLITVGIVREGWLRTEILLDPDTHEFVGSRDVAVADHSETAHEGAQTPVTSANGPGASPVTGGDTEFHVDVPKGELQSLLIRSDIRIVDAAGQTS